MVDDTSERRRALAGVYSRAAPTYDRFASSYFAHFAQRLIERAAIERDARALDAACGTGAVTFALTSVLDEGVVVAVDLAEGMVGAVHDAARDQRRHNVTAAVMDLDHLGLADGCFDAVLCAFALHIVPNPERALAELVRVLRSGGVLACSAWAEDDPRWDWEADVFAAYGATTRLGSHDLESEGALARLLATQPWAELEIVDEEYAVTLHDEEEWWGWKWSYGIRLALEGLDSATLARLKDEAFTRMQPQREASGFPLRLRAWLATTTKP